MGDAEGYVAPPEDPREQEPPSDPEAVARAICLRLLTQRARSRAELADALRKRGVPDEPAGQVLDRFCEVGLIDDAALAESMATAAHTERGLAGRAIAYKLRRRGLDEALVQSAVATIAPDSERAQARHLVAKKLATLRGLDDQATLRRLVGMLARRGYPPGMAYEVVCEAMAEAGAEVETPAGEFGLG